LGNLVCHRRYPAVWLTPRLGTKAGGDGSDLSKFRWASLARGSILPRKALSSCWTNRAAAIFVTARSCLFKGLLVLRLAHRVTCLTNSQARSCLFKGLLVLRPSAVHRVTCLTNSRPGLACSRNYWSCSLLTGYLSCRLTDPVLLAQGVTGLAALSRSQSYLSCKLTV
jgi:hypothetical protein